MILRKIQIIIDIVVLATVVLLEHAVGVLDSWRLRRMLVVCGVVEILILFQLVNQWTPLGVAGTADIGCATATVFVARGVVFQYPNRAGMVVQQLFLVIKSSWGRSGLLIGVVVVVPAGGVVGGIGTKPGMFPVLAGSGQGNSLRHRIVMGVNRLQGMGLLLVVVALQV